MSYSSALIQSPGWLPLKYNGGGLGRTPMRKVVCCCPWSSSGSDSGSDPRTNGPLKKKKKKEFSDKDGKRGDRLPLPPSPSLLHKVIALTHYLIRAPPYHHVFTDLAKEYGPLLHFKVGQLTMVAVSSAEMARELLKNNGMACADRPRTKITEIIGYGYRDIVTSPYGDYWKQMRHVCIAELLSAKNVRSFDYIREEEGSILVDGIKSASRRSSPLNLTEKILLFMNSAMCRSVFGNVSVDRAAMIEEIRATMAIVGNFELADIFPSMKLLDLFSFKAHHLSSKVMPRTDELLQDIIDKHRENLAVTGKGFGEHGTEDFVDALLRLTESDDLQFPLTDDTIKALICDMFAGGTESASSMVDWTMVELVRNPRVMAKLQEEIRKAFNGRKTIEESEIRKLSYLKVVVKESMRLHPPNGIFPRSCREDIEIEGYHIPQNTIVIFNIWGLGRDPMYWQEPERFEPERFEGSSVDFLGNHFEFIPFGVGKRICPAIAFVGANVEFVLAKLLYYYDWKLPAGMRADDLDMTESGGFASSRKSSLHLIATPYAPAFDDVVA